MAVATSKRPKVGSVQKQAVSQVSTFLQDLPEKPKETFSLREAVDQLRSEIQAALAKGYSYEDVAVILTDKGVEISPSTLKNYVPSGKRQAAKDAAAPAKPRGRRSRKTQEDDAATETATASVEPSTPAPATEEPAPAPKRGRGRAKAAAPVDTQPAEEAAPRRGRGRAKTATADEKPAGTRSRSTAKSATKQDAAAKSTTRTTRGRKKGS